MDSKERKYSGEINILILHTNGIDHVRQCPGVAYAKNPIRRNPHLFSTIDKPRVKYSIKHIFNT